MSTFDPIKLDPMTETNKLVQHNSNNDYNHEKKGEKPRKWRSVFPFLLPPAVQLVQTRGGAHHLELRVGARRLLLQLLQVNVDGVEVGFDDGDGQVSSVPRQTHAPPGARQIQLGVLHLLLLQLEVHHVCRLAHVHQQADGAGESRRYSHVVAHPQVDRVDAAAHVDQLMKVQDVLEVQIIVVVFDSFSYTALKQGRRLKRGTSVDAII
ncbi:hypothetical protein F7725_012288 [Dissostichus mawsoni]|uniref:Uncharacterized protein n=1 Tax=Dissostichus mawsoni TaxID=36200 RepID=A0A7J5YLX5_DISMA|nr:hypothetical protein F7725_012288 [Dissostichus mawsoni]